MMRKKDKQKGEKEHGEIVGERMVKEDGRERKKGEEEK